MVLLRAFGTALAKADKDPVQVKMKINPGTGLMSSDNKQANKQGDGIAEIYLVSLC